jgi:hypothetical protein
MRFDRVLLGFQSHNYAISQLLSVMGQFTVQMLPLTISLISHSINNLKQRS